MVIWICSAPFWFIFLIDISALKGSAAEWQLTVLSTSVFSALKRIFWWTWLFGSARYAFYFPGHCFNGQLWRVLEYWWVTWEQDVFILLSWFSYEVTCSHECHLYVLNTKQIPWYKSLQSTNFHFLKFTSSNSYFIKQMIVIFLFLYKQNLEYS